MGHRRKIRSAVAVAMFAAGVVVAACVPPSGLPTRQIALDPYCTLEVRIVEDGGSSYVAARKFGLQWVDGTITGGQSQGCGTWTLLTIDVTTDQATNHCIFNSELGPAPGPGCTAFAPDWYQAAALGALVEGKVALCQTARPPYEVCSGMTREITVLP